jgi:hypothetical protein
MMNYTRFLFFVFAFFIPVLLYGQTEHKWKPLLLNAAKKIWVDENCLKAVKDSVADVWLLELHIPAIEINGSDEKACRVMTLYSINLEKARYCIKKIIYFNDEGKEILGFNYMTDDQGFKNYTYPVLESSPLHMVIKELYKNSSELK